MMLQSCSSSIASVASVVCDQRYRSISMVLFIDIFITSSGRFRSGSEVVFLGLVQFYPNDDLGLDLDRSPIWLVY